MKATFGRLIFSAIGVLAVSALALGCRGAAEKRYRAAERILAQNKPDLATAEYERFIEDFPKHPLVVDACYKLGYLRRTHAADPEAAVEAYEKLATDYPTSRYADDALQWIAWIGRDQGNTARVRQAVRRLESEHSDKPDACARARVQLALALLEAGDAEAKAACDAIVQAYPSQDRQCAQALLIRAQALEQLDGDREAAVKQYEKVMEDYPKSTSAADARQRIGLLFYGQSRTQPQTPADAPPAAKRVEGVPPFAQGVPPGVQRLALEAFRSLLLHKGVDADIPTLMAVSGVAFQFIYTPSDRALGMHVFATNPFETAWRSYGFVAHYVGGETTEDGLLNLYQAVDRDEPALVPHADQGWVIVVGYDQSKRHLTYLRPGTADTRAAEYGEFADQWKQAVDQWGGALPSYYQLSLGLRQRTPDSADLLREGASRAVSLMARRSVFGAPAGPAAYEALIADLEAHATESIPEDAADLAVWSGGALMTLRDARRSAAAFLRARASGLPDAERDAALSAADTYEALDAKLAEMQAAFPTPPAGSGPGMHSPEYAASARQAALFAREAQALDTLAAQQLGSLAAE